MPVVVLRTVGPPPPARPAAKRPAEPGIPQHPIIVSLFRPVLIVLRDLACVHPRRREPRRHEAAQHLHAGQDVPDARPDRGARGLVGIPNQDNARALPHVLRPLDGVGPGLNLADDLERPDGLRKARHDAQDGLLRILLEQLYPGIAGIDVAEQVARMASPIGNTVR